MNKRYVIRWKSKINGRAGKGAKTFDREDAEQLARELNLEYPQIEHDVIPATEAKAQEEVPVLSEA